MKTLIVEDEERSVSALMSEISLHCPELAVTGVAKSVKEAIYKINSTAPQLVFLDVQLTDGSGFDVLESCREIRFKTIFTTAFSEYAIRAIKFSALDYLLKPIESNELVAAVAKARKTEADAEKIKLETILGNMRGPRKRIALQTADKIMVCELENIVYCAAEGNYTSILLTDGRKIMMSKTLGEFDDMLKSSGFERIHHSYLINLSHLVSFTNRDGGYVTLNDKSTLPVSQRKKSQLIQTLNNYNS